MPLSAAEITRHYEYDPSQVTYVQKHPRALPLSIAPWNDAWPARFTVARQRIVDALGAAALTIAHVGSTSVPGLPAKDVIDIDLTVADPANESAYADALHAKGFDLLLREPGWHEHRLFTEAGVDAERGRRVEADTQPTHVKTAEARDTAETPFDFAVNLHVWGPECAEAERHRIFRDWLIAHPDECELYASVKRDSARLATQHGESTMEYNLRKEKVLREILERAFRHHGYLA